MSNTAKPSYGVPGEQPTGCAHFITADTACECGCTSFRWVGPGTARCESCATEYLVSRDRVKT